MYIRIKVFPHSKKEKIIKKENNTFEIYTREKAENNRANIRSKEIIAEYFNMPIKKISIISGHQRPQKILVIQKEEK